jgi:uncharacterized membrane protein
MATDSTGKATTVTDPAMKTANPAEKTVAAVDLVGKATTMPNPNMAVRKKGGRRGGSSQAGGYTGSNQVRE